MTLAYKAVGERLDGAGIALKRKTPRDEPEGGASSRSHHQMLSGKSTDCLRVGGDEEVMIPMGDVDERLEHGRNPARQIALMRDVMPIVALIAALAAMFWQLQG